MRDWTKLLLVACVVALGAGLFLLERRISDLEAQLTAARSEIAAATPVTARRIKVALQDIRDAPITTYRSVVPLEVRPSSPAPRVERQPSGVINGVPYYVVPLGGVEG